jgi:hypothetical protein
MDELLQFIESAPAAEPANAKPTKNNKKTTASITAQAEAKSNQTKAPQKIANKSKQEQALTSTTTVTSEIIKKESPSKVNSKPNRSPGHQQSSDVKPQPPPKPVLVKAVEVIQIVEKKEANLAVVSSVVSASDLLQLNDNVDDLDDQMSAMNLSGEFVTVKGRKLRKESKKKDMAVSHLSNANNVRDTNKESKNQGFSKGKQQQAKPAGMEVKQTSLVAPIGQKQAPAASSIFKANETLSLKLVVFSYLYSTSNRHRCVL